MGSCPSDPIQTKLTSRKNKYLKGMSDNQENYKSPNLSDTGQPDIYKDYKLWFLMFTRSAAPEAYYARPSRLQLSSSWACMESELGPSQCSLAQFNEVFAEMQRQKGHTVQSLPIFVVLIRPLRKWFSLQRAKILAHCLYARVSPMRGF
jgi:hypothetical protein